MICLAILACLIKMQAHCAKRCAFRLIRHKRARWCERMMAPIRTSLRLPVIALSGVCAKLLHDGRAGLIVRLSAL
jgi:hypothetical protein